MKKVWILKISSRILAKNNFNQTIQQRSSISNGNSNTLPLKILTYFEYIREIVPNFSKNYWKCEQKQSNVHKILNIDNSLEKTKNEKIFLFPYSTLDGLFNDIFHNSLRWIYRSVKIDWTKKNQLSI